MTFCGIRNDNNYLQQSIYSTILQFTNVSVAVHMAYVTIYLLSVSCLDKLVHTYSHLPPVCVPGEIID